ncbi:MAG TPA: tetratricopeptide repeat protein [Ramlibacter sp.]|uniref:tetratricopeptide repeat protein n=1 Tax=Ramlibacter sp. TaxID=1917967 RepID=UPI002C2475E2|nr:tetratricopeptide repeat protein [Ramlibacter sp.]HVZ46462.1 tetratricopeptide repeat protein [Ramlibacter sp.]
MSTESSSDPAAAAFLRMFSGETLSDIEAVPQSRLEAAYAEACVLIDSEDFEGALDRLLDLVMQDPYDFRFQFGYGLCLQQLGRTKDAAMHFGLAWMLDPCDAGCAYRLGECHAALGDREAAAEAFETAIALCSPPGLNPDIRLACEAALDQLHA